MSLQNQSEPQLSRNELKVLLALEGSIRANPMGVKRNCGLNKAKVEASLRFFEQKKAISGYYPKIDFGRLGFRSLAVGFFGTDGTMAEFGRKILAKTVEDANVSLLNDLLGVGRHNIFMTELYRSVEDYHFSNLKKYYDAHPEMYRYIREWMVVHTLLPPMKNTGTIATVAKILKHEQGVLAETPHRYSGEMKVDDPVRAAVLAALLKPASMTIDRRAVAEATKISEQRVRSILTGLHKRGILLGCAPRVDVHKFGFQLQSFALLRLDMTQQDEVKKFEEKLLADPYCFFLGEPILSSQWDIIVGTMHRTVDEYNRHWSRYSEAGYDRLVPDRMLFHLGFNKMKDRPLSLVALDILVKEYEAQAHPSKSKV